MSYKSASYVITIESFGRWRCNSCVASVNGHLCAGTLKCDCDRWRARAFRTTLLFCQASKLTQWRRIGALDMLLLQVIHGLAHGEHAGSSRDAKQLARFAAALRDMTHAVSTGYRSGYSPKWAGEKVTLDADKVASLRSLIKEALPHAARLTYEARERLIAKFDSKSSVVRALHKMRTRVLEAIADRELAKAENEKLVREARAEVRAASEAHRKRRREEMQSGECYRKHRKWAREGNAKAVAFFEDVGLRVADLAD